MNESAFFFSLPPFHLLHIEQHFYFRLPSSRAVAFCAHHVVVFCGIHSPTLHVLLGMLYH